MYHDMTIYHCISNIYNMHAYIWMWYVADPDGNMHNLVLVAYKYDGIPQDTILVNPHGNSKKRGLTIAQWKVQRREYQML